MMTRDPDAAIVIADDGSTDGTLEMLRQMKIPVVTGANMGVVWNKNRALFLLSHILGCETAILLEDDARPSVVGWEAQWAQAAQRWGHVNYAADWIREYFISGSGTAEDPVHSSMVTAQCAAYGRIALTFGGYLDPHFKGYGHGHVEHTRRLIRVGYGGIDGEEHVTYKLITGGVTVVPSVSHFESTQEKRNLRLAARLMEQQGYRAPWADEAQLRQFRSEIENAMQAGAA